MREKEKKRKERKQAGPNLALEALIPLITTLKARYNSPYFTHMRK